MEVRRRDSAQPKETTRCVAVKKEVRATIRMKNEEHDTYNSGIWEESEGSVAWLAQGRGENEREREIGRGIDLEGGGLLILKESEQTRLN